MVRVYSTTTWEPVTLDEVKAQLRVTTTESDVMLQTYISIAREQCEKRTHRLLKPSTVVVTVDDFRDLELPGPVFVSTSLSISYIDSTGGSTSVGSSVFSVINDSDTIPALLTTAYGQAWPTCRDIPNAVQITYTGGYSTVNLIPDSLKLWIMMFVGALDNNPELLNNSANLTEVPFAQGLLTPWIVHNMSMVG